MEKAWESFSFSIESLNENKYFIGCAMITLAIGGRFIIDELDDDIRKLLSEKSVRRLFIFCSFFMATRDVLKALLLTIVFVILINEFLGTDKSVTKQDDKDGKGASFNKDEIEKTIQKLKSIQMNM
tara:strand:- start:50 stop:427 length:378 start_codon:yes stop_codon:yes gene_type:complete